MAWLGYLGVGWIVTSLYQYVLMYLRNTIAASMPPTAVVIDSYNGTSRALLVLVFLAFLETTLWYGRKPALFNDSVNIEGRKPMSWHKSLESLLGRATPAHWTIRHVFLSQLHRTGF